MQSIVSYPERGQGGNNKWRGNFAPQLIEDLIDQFHPKAIADPMMGSGTTPDICRRLNVKCWATDLHRGFDIQKGELPLGFDMWIYHPPYWDIIQYSGNMWGQVDPRDGSHIPDYSKFLDWANENLYRMYEALPQGGLIATLTADVRKKGILYPLPMDLTRFGETVATVIKVQHNTRSEQKQYANANFVAIQHEILVISRKPRSIASYWRITGTKTIEFEFDLRTFDKAAWPALVLAAFSQMDGKPTPLSALYDAMQNYARVQLAERDGIDWRAQVRRILQSYACFEQVDYGVWKLKSEQMPNRFNKTHQKRVCRHGEETINMILQINSQPPLAVNIPIMITPNLRHDPSLLIDVKDFMPAIVSSTDKDRVHIHGSFSLANQDRDAGERLGDLVSFIHTSQQASTHGLYIGCTHAVAEQIAYLAYWKDYPLEFRIGRFGSSIVVMAHFPKQPQFDCVLGVFYDRQELHRGVQKWFDCFCQLVRDHAEIWQIHLIVDRPTYRKLEEPRGPKSDILVELVNEE